MTRRPRGRTFPKHLLAGANLINLDNIRGKVLTQLPFFESLLTEPISYLPGSL